MITIKISTRNVVASYAFWLQLIRNLVLPGRENPAFLIACFAGENFLSTPAVYKKLFYFFIFYLSDDIIIIEKVAEGRKNEKVV